VSEIKVPSRIGGVDWVKLKRKVLYHFAKFAIVNEFLNKTSERMSAQGAIEAGLGWHGARRAVSGEGREARGAWRAVGVERRAASGARLHDARCYSYFHKMRRVFSLRLEHDDALVCLFYYAQDNLSHAIFVSRIFLCYA